MTYIINQDFMDCLDAMIKCYSDLMDYYPDNKRFLGTWATLTNVKDMITKPQTFEDMKHIYLNK